MLAAESEFANVLPVAGTLLGVVLGGALGALNAHFADRRAIRRDALGRRRERLTLMGSAATVAHAAATAMIPASVHGGEALGDGWSDYWSARLQLMSAAVLCGDDELEQLGTEFANTTETFAMSLFARAANPKRTEDSASIDAGARLMSTSSPDLDEGLRAIQRRVRVLVDEPLG